MCNLVILFGFLGYISHHIVESARILAVFPTPSMSHQIVFRPLTQELAKRGHDVVVVTTDPSFPKGQTPENLTEINVHETGYKTWIEYLHKVPLGNKEDLGIQMNVFLKHESKGFEMEVQTKEFQKLMDEKKDYFDILIVEACAYPAISLSYIFNVPAIKISSLGGFNINYADIGAYTHPLYYPGPNKNDEIMLKRLFGEDMQNFEELNNNNDLLILNANPMWTENRPAPLGVVFSGGFDKKPTQALSMGLQSYLDNSTNGVIYLSFGSNVETSFLPSRKVQIMLQVFSRLPQNVLMKWESDELIGKPNNVMISKWFPQADLLKHPNIKLFITQGGLHSTDEALEAGVPLIGIPMLGDQYYNVQKYQYYGFGKHLNLQTLTEVVFENAINNVINDKSFCRNAKKIGALMRDQPQSPLSRAVWWTEHVLRHQGAKHLRSPAANMSWAEYFELELIAILLITIIMLLGFLIFVAKLMRGLFCRIQKRLCKIFFKHK